MDVGFVQGADLGLNAIGQDLFFKRHPVLQGLMPVLDLAQGLVSGQMRLLNKIDDLGFISGRMASSSHPYVRSCFNAGGYRASDRRRLPSGPSHPWLQLPPATPASFKCDRVVTSHEPVRSRLLLSTVFQTKIDAGRQQHGVCAITR